MTTRSPHAELDGARPIALITGAAKRVGRATALALAGAGLDVVVTYRSSDADARAAKAQIEGDHGVTVSLERLDLDDPQGAERWAGALAARLPRLDVLVHNASNYFPTALDETTAERASALYRVNALSPLLITKHLAPLLARSDRPGGGSIVCMGDIHAMGRPRSGFAAYAMAKAAVIEMTRSLAVELAPAVRVNALAPGVVKWPDEGYESDEASQQRYLSRVPLARPGEPADAAEVVRWLALDAHYITGIIVPVDGGRTLR